MAARAVHVPLRTNVVRPRLIPPTLEFERELWHRGIGAVAGLDEVGRGPLAGPLYAAAVVLPPFIDTPWLGTVRDSKMLSARQRETLDLQIREQALHVGLGSVSASALDATGVVAATYRAMSLALARLEIAPQHLLIDALKIPEVITPQTSIIRGDAQCISIACASIVAKVARDRLMVELDAQYPGYGFHQHKGYGTAAHLDALRRLGPSPIHRRSFAPVRLLAEASDRNDDPH